MALVAFGLTGFVGTAKAHQRLTGEPFAPAVAMDFDGDGRDDLLVRRPVFDPTGEAFGSIEIYCVQRRELLLLLSSEWSNDLFGFSASSAGDLTGDGFTDIVVGAPYAMWIDEAAEEEIDSEDASRRGAKAGDGAANDADGDALGESEAEATAPWPHGRVDVFAGSTGQLVLSLQHPDVFLLGRVVAGVGDVNGDGVPDVAASGYVRDANGNAHERVIIFCGLTGDAFRVFTPERSGEGFGHTIVGLGDLDGDGYADLAIGAPDAIANARIATGQGGTRGVVYVFRGEPMPEVAEVLLSDGPITQVRRANRHAFARIGAESHLLEFARHIVPGPIVMIDAHGAMIDDLAEAEHDAEIEVVATMLTLSLRFDQATRQSSWLAETIDPLTGARLARTELPRFERGGDVTRDLTVGDEDLRTLIAMLGLTPDPNDPFNADLTGTGTVDTTDLERATQHFGDRHELLDLVARTGDAMFVVMDELAMPGRLAIAADAACTVPVRTKYAPGIMVLCAGDAMHGVQWLPGAHGADSIGDGDHPQEDNDGFLPSPCAAVNEDVQVFCACCCPSENADPACGIVTNYRCSSSCHQGIGTGPGGGTTDPCPGGDCDNIPEEFDCNQSGTGDCCDPGPGPWFGGGPPPAHVPNHPQNQDDDCDGIPNWADCDSDCYIGDAENDCACKDDNDDGILNQDTCGHPCAHPELLCIKLMVDSNNDGVINEQDEQAKQQQSSPANPGLIVFVNNNYTLNDELPDRLILPGDPQIADPDLKPMTLSIPDAGPDDEWSITYPTHRVRIVWNPYKIADKAPSGSNCDLEQEQIVQSGKRYCTPVPEELYIEGLTPSTAAGAEVIRLDWYSQDDEGDCSEIIGSDTVRLTVVWLDMIGDSNRDGLVTPGDGTDPAGDNIGKHKWEYGEDAKGMIILVNNTDQNGDKEPDYKDAKLKGDGSEVSLLGIRKLIDIELPSGWEMQLTAGTHAEKVRVHWLDYIAPLEVLGPLTRNPEVLTLDQAALAQFSKHPNYAMLGIEGLEYPGWPDTNFDGLLTLTLRVVNGSDVVQMSDEIQMRVAPWMMLSHADTVINTYVTNTFGARLNSGNAPDNEHTFIQRLVTALGGWQSPHVANGALRMVDSTNPWVQDQFEIGFHSKPGRWNNVVLESPRVDGQALRVYAKQHMLDPDIGLLSDFADLPDHDQNRFGNLEVFPPMNAPFSLPHGKIFHGNLLNQIIADFLESQSLQASAAVFDTDWLVVGHVDEIISVQIVNGQPTAIIADPMSAIDILEQDLTKLYDNGSLWEDDRIMTAQQLLDDYKTDNIAIHLNLEQIEEVVLWGIGIPIKRVPVYFFEYLPGRFCAALPNMVNMLNVNGQLIVPEPFDSRFRNKFVQEVGITPAWIDCLEYHWGFGQVHCGTNTRREPKQALKEWWTHEP